MSPSSAARKPFSRLHIRESEGPNPERSRLSAREELARNRGPGAFVAPGEAFGIAALDAPPLAVDLLSLLQNLGDGPALLLLGDMALDNVQGNPFTVDSRHLRGYAARADFYRTAAFATACLPDRLRSSGPRPPR